MIGERQLKEVDEMEKELSNFSVPFLFRTFSRVPSNIDPCLNNVCIGRSL